MKNTVYKTANNPRMEVNPKEERSRMLLSGHKMQLAAIRMMDVRLVKEAGRLLLLNSAEKISPSRPVYMMETKKHWINTIESTIHAVLGPKAVDHSPLKVFSPVISQALAMRIKVWDEHKASVAQIKMEGIHPVPLAFPAASVKIPAPATLFAKLKMEVVTDALPPSALDLLAPPRLMSNTADEMEEVSDDLRL
mmetsp:Transcript_21678/g.53545  ORF Transcript_21678/g.53545 Transcript_21678/m.53545 type:complete len:194 (-) Transcript_21678:85-666(-)